MFNIVVAVVVIIDEYYIRVSDNYLNISVYSPSRRDPV
jgi:hypothetical protein